MLGDARKIVKLLNDLKLSHEEFYFLYLIQMYKNERTLHETAFTKNFELYYEINKKKYTYNKFLAKYESFGYIINNNKPDADPILFNKLVITDRFKSIFISDIDECWKQVKEIYPKKMWVNDGYYFTATATRGSLKEDYYRLVTKNGDRFLHEEFISLTEFFYDGDRDKTDKKGAMKLEKWIYSWEDIKDTILNDMNGGSSPLQYKLFT